MVRTICAPGAALKLPNRERAYVPPGKLLDYLLAPTHPVGRHKAAYFAALGFTLAEPEALERELLRVAREGAVLGTVSGEYGTKYIVEGEVHTPGGGRAVLATVWFTEAPDAPPRLITAYPGAGRDSEKECLDDS